ncbi:MAG TPA: hypothetical protein VMF70_13650 [Gemmatimonadales bacterium]|nr:hypothetical protein [Gemmatimonadales bacterium]
MPASFVEGLCDAEWRAAELDRAARPSREAGAPPTARPFIEHRPVRSAFQHLAGIREALHR